MIIKSIRYGFSNNSSSSHSIIIVSDHKMSEILTNYSGNSSYEYGWEFFTLPSKKDKAMYLLATLILNLINLQQKLRTKPATAGYEIVEIKKQKILYTVFDDLDSLLSELTNSSYYVDHQSLISLPMNYHKTGINFDFFADMSHELINKNYVILGGNDNTSEDHELASEGDVNSLINYLHKCRYDETLAVKDDENGDWVIQNLVGGTIFRLNFDGVPEIIKGGFPTLVDLKITNQCYQGCKFCYQSSTKEGKHASEDNIVYILEMLRKTNTLEIVFGGGEPTLHPQIGKILDYSKELGFAVGLTTKDYELTKHPEFDKIIENLDSLAISCHTKEEIVLAYSLKEIIKTKKKQPQIYIQTILELESMDYLRDYLAVCKERGFWNITLLGYKNFGFGKKNFEKRYKYDANWIDIVSKAGLNIGVDAAIIKEWRDDLIYKGVKEQFMTGHEGYFSCYIDIVDFKMGESSYVDKMDAIPKFEYPPFTTEINKGEFNEKKFLANFKKYGPVPAWQKEKRERIFL